MDAVRGQWFDGRSARARSVELVWREGRLCLLAEGLAERQYAPQELRWPERTRHGQRQLGLPDGGVVDLDDAAAWDALAAQAGHMDPLAVRWAWSWRATLVSALLLIGIGFASWRWGLPAAADAAAAVFPVAWEEKIGRSALEDLDEHLLKPSRLEAAERKRIEQALGGMAALAYPNGPPRYRLHFRDGGKVLGPNAFVLPGGDIVLTDALVRLLPSAANEPVSPALLGVLAHELGHVQHRHGLRMLVKASLSSALIGLWVGDFSSVLATLPAWLAQAAYSRDAEREADSEGLRVMRAAGLDPRAMLLFFQALKRELPEREGDDRHFGLSTHPTDAERIRRFEEAAR